MSNPDKLTCGTCEHFVIDPNGGPRAELTVCIEGPPVAMIAGFEQGIAGINVKVKMGYTPTLANFAACHRHSPKAKAPLLSPVFGRGHK